ncbi:MAG: cell division protein FtsQ/DivIB [Candidatus Binatia bacterium]
MTRSWSLMAVGAGWWRRQGPRRRAGLGVVSAACGAALVVAAWYVALACVQRVRAHPYFAVAEIDIEGNRRLSRQDILEWVGLRRGMSLWDVSPSALQARLERHPWIRAASVERAFPQRVVIAVGERAPVAILRLDRLNYVDSAGRILGPLRHDDAPDFPVITGLEHDAGLRGFAPLGIHRALQLLRWCQRLSCFAISEIHVDQHRGITIFPLRMAVAVVLGWGGWREKLARAARVLAAWKGQVGRLAAVDVSFRHMVVVRLRDVERHPAAVRASKRGLRV